MSVFKYTTGVNKEGLGFPPPINGHPIEKLSLLNKIY